jgi:hypothetical protein
LTSEGERRYFAGFFACGEKKSLDPRTKTPGTSRSPEKTSRTVGHDVGGEVVTGVDEEVGFEAGERLDPGSAMLLPGGQVQVGDVEDPDGLRPGGQERQGVVTDREEVRFDDRTPDAGGRGSGKSTGEESTLLHFPNSIRSPNHLTAAQQPRAKLLGRRQVVIRGW